MEGKGKVELFLGRLLQESQQADTRAQSVRMRSLGMSAYYPCFHVPTSTRPLVPLLSLIRLHSLDTGICDIKWNIWELGYYNY